MLVIFPLYFTTVLKMPCHTLGHLISIGIYIYNILPHTYKHSSSPDQATLVQFTRTSKDEQSLKFLDCLAGYTN